MRMRAALGLVGEMTARHVTDPYLIEGRMLGEATIPRIGTAVVEAAASRPRSRWRHRARNRRETFPLLTDMRHRVEQAFRVRMMRLFEEVAHRGLLDDLSAIHHDDTR